MGHTSDSQAAQVTCVKVFPVKSPPTAYCSCCRCLYLCSTSATASTSGAQRVQESMAAFPPPFLGISTAVHGDPLPPNCPIFSFSILKCHFGITSLSWVPPSRHCEPRTCDPMHPQALWPTQPEHWPATLPHCLLCYHTLKSRREGWLNASCARYTFLLILLECFLQ